MCFQLFLVNTLRPRHNGHRFADDTLKRTFFNENVRFPIEISLKFVPKGPINNIPALVQIMAWRQPGDKPLSALMMVSLLVHICVTRPQWVNFILLPLHIAIYMYIINSPFPNTRYLVNQIGWVIWFQFARPICYGNIIPRLVSALLD